MHRSAIILLVVLAILALNPFTVLANATIVVNTVDDQDGYGAECSLREAIISANSNANYGGCTGTGTYAADTINFDAGVFGSPQMISLGSDLPDITSKITINGPGAGFLTINGNANYQPFYVNVPLATVITISNMLIESARNPVVGGNGGVLYVASGTVTVNNMIVANSLANNNGGAFYVNIGAKLTVNNSDIGSSTALADGGAIYNAGTLRVSNSRFVGNAATGFGGAIASIAGASTTIGGSEFFGNDSGQTGGAFYGVTGTGGIFNSTFFGNDADFGGAVGNSDEGTLTLVHVTIAENTNGDGNSGGIFVNNGRLRVYNSILADNMGDCFADSGLMDEVTVRYSLIKGNPVCGITDGVNGNIITDAFLYNIQNNGGTTLTMAVSPASPAVNKGSNSYQSEATSNIDFNGDGDKSDTLSTDQRGTGFVRRFGTTVDMGAFETTATFTGLNVDTSSDDNLHDCTSAAADCSLRGAILLANARSGTDTINFVPSVFPATTTITLGSDLPDISSSMNIVGLDTSTIEISGNNSYRPFTISAGHVVTISDLSIVYAYSSGAGGAISVVGGTLNLNDVDFAGNHSDWNGGAIFATNTNLNISEGYFNLNTSDASGGAIYHDLGGTARIYNSSFISNSADSWGGAIHAYAPVIGGSTFSQNTAVYAGAIAANGGTIFNSTFHGHHVAGEGGAVNTNLGPIVLNLINVTISDSSAGLQGAGVYVGDGQLFVANSIIANSTGGGDCTTNSGIVTVRNSLIEDGGCGTVSGVDGNVAGEPFLDPAGLQNNGGSTLTISTVSSSPVVNGGDNQYLSETFVSVDFNGDGDFADTLATDQRGTGNNRIFNTTVDMGAYESMGVFEGLNVDTTSDDNLYACTGSMNDCSLRGAINVANSRPGVDTISFDTSIFNSPQTITLGSELPIISGDLAIVGPGRDILTIDGNALYRHFRVGSGIVSVTAINLINGNAATNGTNGGSILVEGGHLYLINSSLSANVATDDGGGLAVYNPGYATLFNSSLNNNSAGDGGAIFATNNLVIHDSSFDNNTATSFGGAIHHTGFLSVEGSLFSNNTAGNGGAIFAFSGSAITNSTFYDNHAEDGGAIYVNSASSTMVNLTFSENGASSEGAVYAAFSTVNIYNSIIANSSSGGDCSHFISTVMLYNSLVEDGSCDANMGVNDSLMGDPFLDPAGLQDNGGTIPTIALASMSPAVDAGNSIYLNESWLSIDYNWDGDTSDSIETDQRGTGFNRLVNGTVDMGAFESTAPAALVVDTTSDANLFMCTEAANDCSLRGAINIANTNTSFTGATISFDATVFATAQTVTLTGSLPTIDTNMNIVGPGANLLTINGANLYRAFLITDEIVNISGITIQDSLSTEEGGAIYLNNAELNLSNMSFIDNVSQEFGGAIYLESTSSLSVRNSYFSNNSATEGGGAIFLVDNSMNSLLIISSSFSENSADFGGAIDGSAVIVNSSFNGNISNIGGTLYLNDDNDVLSLINVTINESSVTTGSALRVFRGTAELFNTIIANTSGGSDCSFDFGTVSASYSMVEDGSCGVTSGINNNLTGETFLDGTGMQNNGGLNPSVALAPLSPARNAGNNSFLDESFANIDYNGDGDLLDTLSTDQRGTGFNRVFNSTVDMGAFEVSSSFAGLVVDTTSPDNLLFCTSAPNDCSLYGAITIANAVAGADTITFDATVFVTAQTIEPGFLPTITSEINITGPGSDLLTINGAGAVLLTVNHSSAALTLSGMRIQSGWSVGNGGAVNLVQGSLSVNSVVFANNIADGQGGAIYAAEGTSLTITNSTFHSNSTPVQGGAIWTEGTTKIFNSSFTSNMSGSSGGAIYSTDVMTIGGSSFEENTAGNGGAIYSNNNTLISNSSFYGNFASINGGAIYNVGQFDMVNVTIFANTSGVHTTSANFSMVNSIIAESAVTNCSTTTTNPSIVHSLFDTDECGLLTVLSHDNIVADAFLDPRGLEPNGGPTETIALAPLSPAVNAGNISLADEFLMGLDFNADGDFLDTLTTDQRGAGFNRINGNMDMGAFESSGTFAGLTVDTNSDSNLIFCTSAANDCSLRGTMTLANVLSGADSISFSSSVFNTAQTITLTEDLPTITENLSITGSGANLLTISGAGLYRQFHINNSATVSLSGMTIRDGFDTNGASIFLASGSLSLNAMSFIENTADANGGAILTDSGTSLSITNSSFTSNSANGKAGAVYSRGILNVSNSSFTSNSARPSSGAIYADGLTFIGGSSFGMNTADNGGAMEITTATTIFNSSFYNHSVSVDGGTFFLSSSSLNLISVTVTGGSASSSGGGVVVFGGTLSLMNSIIANSSGGDCQSYGGTVTVNFSLIEDGSCGVTSGVNGNLTGEPYLAPFANYGGTTRAIALLPHSPAINMGNSAYLSEANVSLDFNNDGDMLDTLDTDQRGTGFNRVNNGTVDMGAFEANPVTSGLNVAPIRNYYTTNTPTLSWSRVSWATGYEVQISSTTGFGTILCGGTQTIDGSSQTLTTCELPAGTYYWRVRALSATGTGAWSTVDVFVIGGP